MKTLLKKIGIGALLCLIASFNSYSQYVLEGDLFTITFPEAPKFDESNVDSELGHLKMVTYSYESSDYTICYAFSFSDYPENSFDDSNIDNGLQNSMNGFVGAMEGMEITYKSNIYLNNYYKGIYYKADSGTMFCVNKSYLVKDRLYQLVIMTIGSYASDTEEASFFDTFKIK